MSDQDFFLEIQDDFINEGLGMMEQFEQGMLALEKGQNSPQVVAEIFRVAHSIKGGASAVGFKELSEFAHKVEDMLAYFRVNQFLINADAISLLLKCSDVLKNRLLQLKDNRESAFDFSILAAEVQTMIADLDRRKSDPVNNLEKDQQQANSATSTQVNYLKVDESKIELLLDSVGEIVVLKNQILHDKNLRNSMALRVSEVLDQLDRMVRDLYDKTLGLRLTPLSSLFLKVQRIVRDISLQLDKNIELELIGADTEVERTVSEVLVDPLVHMVRNALDHGIEGKEERVAKNKPPTARILVKAEQIGGSVRILVQDDGRGIHREKVLKKAVDSGIVEASLAAQYSDQQVYQLLFAPGFSTAQQVTDLSGRGVGLDVVKSNLAKVGGRIEIESEIDKGSCFSLVIPLTTAIIDGVIFVAGNERYIIPVQYIKEILQLNSVDLTHVHGQGDVVKIRNHIFPIYRWENCSSRIGILVETPGGNFILGTDRVEGQTQAVVKPLTVKTHPDIFGGAAVMGDGSTLLIINPHEVHLRLRAS